MWQREEKKKEIEEGEEEKRIKKTKIGERQSEGEKREKEIKGKGYEKERESYVRWILQQMNVVGAALVRHSRSVVPF